ncbi:MAG TPA: WbqC family protein, partial [Puia sp.]|nr:WbqC family protein [Puia sp.]
MKLIIESQYFPPLTCYKGSCQLSNIVFEQYDHFQKMSFRNRLLMANANGVSVLSVPVEQGRNQKTLMKEVRIANRQSWQLQHWRSLESAYNRSPWFEFYRDELAALYKKPFHFLLDWNLSCFEWTMEKLEWEISISRTKSYQKTYDPAAWIDRRGAILPKNYKGFPPVKYH